MTEQTIPMEMSFRTDTMDALKTHTAMMKLHYKALCCHCEVMGMMSENTLSAMLGTMAKFTNQDFTMAMSRWGLVDKDGKSII